MNLSKISEFELKICFPPFLDLQSTSLTFIFSPNPSRVLCFSAAAIAEPAAVRQRFGREPGDGRLPRRHQEEEEQEAPQLVAAGWRLRERRRRLRPDRLAQAPSQAEDDALSAAQ